MTMTTISLDGLAWVGEGPTLKEIYPFIFDISTNGEVWDREGVRAINAAYDSVATREWREMQETPTETTP